MRNSRNTQGTLNVTGKIIRHYRLRNNFSYQDLSDKLMLIGVDINKQSIYRIEIGKRTVVDYEFIAFAICLNISLDELAKDFNKILQ